MAGKSSIVCRYRVIRVMATFAQIMQSFPFHWYVFDVLTVERPGERLTALLTTHSYVYVGRTSNFDDELWMHRDFLLARFNRTTPPAIEALFAGFSGTRCRPKTQ